MHRLIDDITDFLGSRGIGCSRQLRNDSEVVCAELPDGKSYKVILPLEINAESLEKARLQSEVTEGSIRFIKSMEGYPLVITEDRWKSRRPMMEARLLAHLEIFSSVFARKCIVRRIDKAEAQEFLTSYHSYGYAACKYRYGLFSKDDGRLIAAAAFSNARKWIKDGKEIHSYEWTRYASLPGLRICGGMGKMLNAFISEVNPDDIMSYADLEWSEGDVYKTLGFKREDGKEAVDFIIDPETWERRPVRKHDKIQKEAHEFCFRNFGSAKYRLKLTDYQ